MSPGYNFKRWTAELVESGAKRQTIRPQRKRPTVPGDTLYLFYGQRTKSCRQIGIATCKSVEPVEFMFTPKFSNGFRARVTVNGRLLTDVELHRLALADGFNSVKEFFDFFEDQYGIPNDRPLELIKW